MKTRALILGALATAALVLAASAGALVKAEKPQTATAKGVGEVRLGRTIAQLREAKLIGGVHKGCELAAGEKAAKLKAPLSGSAIFYPGKRLSAISLTGGARTAAGIGIGSSVADARKAYPSAPYDKPKANAPIPVGLIWIGGRKNPKMTLVVAPGVLTVTEIAIPGPSFCE
jgi:hypothetical protein